MTDETDKTLLNSKAAFSGSHLMADKALCLRKPQRSDGARIHALIQQCPPLDLNSVYTYLLLSEHFADTCILAGRSDEIDGFVSAYIPPARPDVLFVWQVAVHARARGQRLGQRMLASLLSRPDLATIQYVETTVGPGNCSSRRMFGGLALRFSADVNESPLFESGLFGKHSHDDEPLLRIGPLSRAQAASPSGR